MFIPRMWFDETERIGKQRCTPFGYALQSIGDLIGFLGLLSFFGILTHLMYRVQTGSFIWSLLWMLAIPFVMGIVGKFMVDVSWWMALRKKFH